MQNVRFIAADLEEHSITPLKADARIKQLVYQRLHYTKGMTCANADLHTPFEKDEIYSSVVKQLTQLVNGKKTLTNEEIKNFINLLQEPNKSRTHEPFHALGACGSEIFTKVRRDLSQRPQDAKQILSSLLERINTERVMAVNEMLDILPASSNISKARLEEKFDSNPAAFHRLYQRYALLAQENKTNETFIKKTFPTSYQKLDQEDSLSAARNLLNDYTKNNSAGGRAFTFHWFRHHTDEVNQIVEKIDKGKIMSVDELIKELREIKLTNSKGSLSRRIDFIVFQHVEAQAKMADLGDIQTNQADIIEDTDKQSFRI
ncbi:DUF5617 domain-containing protein [Legionella erythra]|uniref:Leucine-rich repeat-containing protein n=1 Tax=Legionella erythra TaxID=448 RepID=A0A0W0TS79_LEGER|nr:DUF5617 domain-containing protein [Legionella erythra]KTC98250.1 leucine-rich repeat-containing protein [Legionella erythra]